MQIQSFVRQRYAVSAAILAVQKRSSERRTLQKTKVNLKKRLLKPIWPHEHSGSEVCQGFSLHTDRTKTVALNAVWSIEHGQTVESAKWDLAAWILPGRR
jgi:hypothetical protein